MPYYMNYGKIWSQLRKFLESKFLPSPFTAPAEQPLTGGIPTSCTSAIGITYILIFIPLIILFITGIIKSIT